MRREFIKYQSLGNNFIIFDWYKKPQVFIEKELNSPDWHDFIISSCNQHTGIGADGVLILKRNPEKMIHEMLVFNNDGTQAENCLNGTRCIADYLKNNYRLGLHVDILIGQRIVTCTFDASNNITMNAGKASQQCDQSVSIDGVSYSGHNLNIGNPHFIVFQKISRQLFEPIGKKLATHADFAHGTNVEFIWHESSKYHTLVYERGCGTTQACSSGAAAIVSLLNQQQKINPHDKVFIQMLGGTVTGWSDNEQNIFLTAPVHKVFTGSF
jgi:diaminopimelate epimerase